MNSGRRIFLTTAMSWAAAGPLGAQFGPRQHGMENGLPQTPDASGGVRRPTDYPPNFPPPDPKQLLRENRKHIQRDAVQLLEMARALKEEADQTQQTNVLSLSLIHKAEAIEHLAKQIKGLARAS